MWQLIIVHSHTKVHVNLKTIKYNYEFEYE